jgi:hypothetical protein
MFKIALQDGIINGIADSGFELDFVGGFNHRTHEWKKKNVYLNGLISLMYGKNTKWRMGFLPRTFMPIQVHPRMINFCDRYTRFGEIIATLGKHRLTIIKEANPLSRISHAMAYLKGEQ